MKVENAELNVYVLTFTSDEMRFFKSEAKENNTTTEALIEELFAMVFSGGYTFLTGKET